MFSDVIKGCDYLIPQFNPEGYFNSYWTYALKYENTKVSWKKFREKYVEMGGDGIYAAWLLSYKETVMSSGSYKKKAPYYYKDLDYPDGICPVAEKIQPKLMQFVTNYGSVDEALPKIDALKKTIKYFS